MTAKKKAAPAPTPAPIRPEQYHLDQAPRMRELLRKAAADLEASAVAKTERDIKAKLRSLGYRVPPSAKVLVKRDRYSASYSGVQIGAVRITIDDKSLTLGNESQAADIRKDLEASNQASHRGMGLCKLIKTGAAREFGAFCRAKYGPKPDLATIRKAHGEWLDLQLNCKC